MDENEWADRLMSQERREWQNPDAIISRLGMRKGNIIADLGCGPGFFTIPIAKAVCPEGHVYAVDSSSTMLEHLRRNVRKGSHAPISCLTLVQRDVTDTGIPDERVNFSFFANVLHDVENRHSFWNEVRRITVRGGFVVNVDWKKEETEGGPPVSIRLEKDEVVKEAAAEHLEFLKDFECGKMHYGLLFRKS